MGERQRGGSKAKAEASRRTGSANDPAKRTRTRAERSGLLSHAITSPTSCPPLVPCLRRVAAALCLEPPPASAAFLR